MADQVQDGDKASWNWNGNQPSGTTGEVKAGEATVTSNHGNETSKTGDADNPAVHAERPSNDVVKQASELTVEEKGPAAPEAEEKATTHENEPNGSDSKAKEDEAKAGEKRKADEKADADADADANAKGDGNVNTGEAAKAKEEEQEAKKQKTEAKADGAANGVKKGAARSKPNGEKKPAGAKKEKKVPAVGKSQRKTRSQGAA